MTQTMSQEDGMICPGCNQMVDPAFYSLHVQGDGTAAPHTLKLINIKGVGTQVVPQAPTGKPVMRMMDLPYLGRVRTEPFIAYTIGCILLGVLMGLRII
jgi:hypothetical protein